MNRVTRAVGNSLIYLVLPVALLAIWWFASAGSTNFAFPALSSILTALRENWWGAQGWEQIQPSLVNLMIGYVLAVLIGIALGSALARVRFLRELLMPVVDLMRSIPGPVLLPVGVLALGVGNNMKIAIICFGSIWPTLFGTYQGVRGVETVRLHMSRIFLLRPLDRWHKVILPDAAPHIISGMQTSLQVAFVLVVISELIASTYGIGYTILQASQAFRYDEVWAGAIVLGLLGLVLHWVFDAFKHFILRWRRHEMKAKGRST